MKKTLFATISILLMLFAFVACDGSNPGPTGGDVTESEANTLAGTYFGSINFSQLIVDAFDDTVTTIDVASLSKDGFTIEFDKYAGKALSKTTATTPANKAAATDDSATEEEEPVTITEITSGTIEFTFTTANSKTTYTAKTAADDPIVFKGAPEGADLAFDITGEANITFTRLGTDGAITNLASESTVKIGAPDATKSTISVGGTSVDYDDIKESAKGGFDQTATAPVVEGDGGETTVPSFSETEAKTALSNIINDISRKTLIKDVMEGLKGLDDSADTIKGVTLENGPIAAFRGTKSETLTNLFVDLIKGTDFTTDSGTKLTQYITDLKKENLDLTTVFDNIYDVTMEMTVSFKNYNPFKNKATDNTDATFANLITSGSAAITLSFGRGDLESKTLEGTYKAKMDDITVVSVDSDIYNISFDNFYGTFSLTSDKQDVTIPARTDDRAEISISKNSSKPVTLNWADDLATNNGPIAGDSNFTEGDTTLIDTAYFYQHFGSKRFLNAIYDALDNGGSSTDYKMKITNYTDSGIAFDDAATTETKENEKSVTFEINFADYIYYKKASTQTVSGNVNITFTGTVSDSTKFTATKFSVEEATLDVKDSSTTNKRPDAKATIEGEGHFGTNSGNIVFVTDGSKITGITEYINKADDQQELEETQIEYVQTSHEFVLNNGIDSIEIKLS